MTELHGNVSSSTRQHFSSYTPLHNCQYAVDRALGIILGSSISISLTNHIGLVCILRAFEL